MVAGGPSGSGLAAPDGLVRLADELGISARVRFLPPRTARSWPAVSGRRPGRGSQLFGVVRVGRGGGAGLRHAGGGGRGRRAAGGRARRDQRHPGCRPRRRPVADAIDELLRLGAGPRAWAMSHSAVRHAARFSWENTVDALLASYRRAISEFGGPGGGGSAVWQRRAARASGRRRGGGRVRVLSSEGPEQ
ncbi:D-inositol-3-phosphate glycosyltransferase domain protein [Mycobacterium xenopi 4042]|uniref:D-inositol-3-phosphate glycosyltransferase domain protein n=1 Tax=Mycobacterium xenopi 4042 TaxID=1299334 RepID=X8DMH5_MYCXE|nr:D-inositol-3-phosphate glycosyltransferase domain protein [Mycobacterium xenopi 4042]